MTNETKKKEDDRTGLVIGGSIVLGIGILFLLVNLDIIPGFDRMWPIFIIIVGLALLIGSLVKGKKAEDIEQH